MNNIITYMKSFQLQQTFPAISIINVKLSNLPAIYCCLLQVCIYSSFISVSVKDLKEIPDTFLTGMRRKKKNIIYSVFLNNQDTSKEFGQHSTGAL